MPDLLFLRLNPEPFCWFGWYNYCANYCVAIVKSSNIPGMNNLNPHQLNTDEDLEKQLRPQSLDEFIGQEKIKQNLRVFLTAALQRGEALDHVMLSGPP